MQVLDVVAEERRREDALARSHPVDVAAQGVDFTVVRDHAVGMGAGPAGEGVGRETRVHERQRRHHSQLGQIWEIRIELLGGEHALVHDGASRKAADVEEILVRDVTGANQLLGRTANQAQLALERLGVREGRAPADEDLADERLGCHRALAKANGIDGHVAPAEQRLSKLGNRLFENPLAAPGGTVLLWEKNHAYAVLLGGRQRNTERIGHVSQKRVRNLKQNSRAVAGVFFTATGASMG